MSTNTSYFSVIIPCAASPELVTEWHPTDRVGPFSSLTRGVFQTEEAAHEWARTHIPGSEYSVKEYA